MITKIQLKKVCLDLGISKCKVEYFLNNYLSRSGLKRIGWGEYEGEYSKIESDLIEKIDNNLKIIASRKENKQLMKTETQKIEKPVIQKTTPPSQDIKFIPVPFSDIDGVVYRVLLANAKKENTVVPKIITRIINEYIGDIIESSIANVTI